MRFLHKEIVLIALAYLATLTHATRIKRMYALCPPHFVRIGNECYFFATDRVNWLDAHFDCKDRNSRLAEPIKTADRRLRKYLQQFDTNRIEKWIGGVYNWERNKWQWGYNGRDMTYQSFSQMMPGTLLMSTICRSSQDLKFHCAVVNPQLKYRWSARSCVEKRQYVCQHRMPYVSRKNRERVYTKWNETYPNEMANEVEVIINQDDRQRNDRQRHLGEARHRQEVLRNDMLHNGLNPQQRPRKNYEVRRTPNYNRTPYIRTPHRIPRKHVPKTVQQAGKDKDLMANEVLRNPVVAYAPDPYNELRLNETDHEIKQREHRRRKKIQHQQDRDKQRRRKKTPTPTTPTTPTPMVVTNATTIGPLINSDDLTTKTTLKITKEEMKKKEEERELWEKEQIRLKESKRILEEEAHQKQTENEWHAKQEAERQRHDELMRRAKEREKQALDFYKMQIEQKERANQQDLEKQKQLREEQEKVRQQELRNQQIEQRIRQNEEDKRQKELAEKRAMVEAEATSTTTVKIPESNQHNEVTPRILEDPRIEDIRRTEEEKRIHREKVRQRLQQLTPEQLKTFFQKRAERNKKRGAAITNNDTAIPNN